VTSGRGDGFDEDNAADASFGGDDGSSDDPEAHHFAAAVDTLAGTTMAADDYDGDVNGGDGSKATLSANVAVAPVAEDTVAGALARMVVNGDAQHAQATHEQHLLDDISGEAERLRKQLRGSMKSADMLRKEQAISEQALGDARKFADQRLAEVSQSYRDEAHDLHTQIGSLQAELSECSEARRQLGAYVASERADITALMNQSRSEAEAASETAKELAQERTARKALEAKVVSFQMSLNKTAKALLVSDAASREKGKAVAALRRQADDNSVQMRDVIAVKDANMARALKAEKRLAQREEELREAKDALRAISGELAGSKVSLNRSRQDLAAATERASDLGRVATEEAKELSVAKADLNTMHSNLSSMKASLNTSRVDLVAMNERAEDLGRAVSDEAKELATGKKHLSTRNEELRSTWAALNITRQNLAVATERADDLGRTASDQAQELRSTHTALNEANTKLAAAEAKVARLQNFKSQFSAVVDELKSTRSELDEEAAALRAARTEVERGAKREAANLNETRAETAAALAGLRELQSARGELKAEVNELRTTGSDLLRGARPAAAELNATRGEMTAAVAELRVAQANWNAEDVAAARAQIAGARSVASKINSK
jgi:chromosome segregation ATPase